MKVNDADNKEPSVGRRSLLRGGAVIAGAGLAGTALAQPAAAAPVNYVQLGAPNAETTATELTVNAADGDVDVAALRLTNADGPSLYLNPLDAAWNGSLKNGEIANTDLGPLVGITDPTADEGTTVTSFLATGIDLAYLPTPLAVPPTRLLDTRTAAGRKGILASSPNAFGPDFKLRKNAYVDILVAPTAEGFDLPSVFINLTAVDANGTGFLTAYPPGAYPGTSTLNVVRGQTVANAAFVAAREVDLASGDSYYAIRVLTTAECWILVDLTGAVISGLPTANPAAARRAAAVARPSIVKKMLTKVAHRR